MYPCPESGNRCPVFILDEYISKLPDEARAKNLFYAQPLKKVPKDPQKPWYSAVPLGKNTLRNKFRTMCEDAQIKGNKTNHSLRATAATEMFRNGAPEKVIQERTGHRSLEALRTYERSDEAQHRAMSSLLANVPGKVQQQVSCMQQLKARTEAVNISQTFSSMPAISLHDIHGCTINFNYSPSEAPTVPHQSTTQTAQTKTCTETELNNTFTYAV